MPRSAYFSKEEIIGKALEIVREKGEEALSARSLSKALNCSISPIFTVFKNMEEVSEYTRNAAKRLFSDIVSDVNEFEPALKEFGLRLIRFAREEPNLFHYLFLRKHTASEGMHPKAQECLESICDEFGISICQADIMLRQLWALSCGLAVLSTKDAETYTEEKVGEMLSFQFASSVAFLKSGKQAVNIVPKHK